MLGVLMEHGRLTIISHHADGLPRSPLEIPERKERKKGLGGLGVMAADSNETFAMDWRRHFEAPCGGHGFLGGGR